MGNEFIKEVKRIAAITIAFAFLFSWTYILRGNIRQKEEESLNVDVVKLAPVVSNTPTPVPTIKPSPTPKEIEYSIELKNKVEIGSEVLAQGIDLSVFKSYNPSTIAAIAVPGTRMYYPICFPFDKAKPDEWLDKNFSLKHSYHGVIYLDSINNPQLSDSINSLYGHNMKDGSMFADINKYLKDKKYIKANPDLFLITEDEISIYSAIGVMRVPQNEGEYRRTGFDKPSDYEKFYASILSKSITLADAPVNTDSVLELITCSPNHNYRTILFLSKILTIPNVVIENNDMSSEVESLTKGNKNYHTLYSNIIKLNSENDMLFITDKNDKTYAWTKEELEEKYKNQLGLETQYISGYKKFENDGVSFSVISVNGSSYLILKGLDVKSVEEIEILYIPKNEIKVKRLQ